MEQIALIPCPGCKREVSNKAHECPGCGHVFNNKERQTVRIMGTNVFLSLAVLFDVVMHNIALLAPQWAQFCAILSLLMVGLYIVGAMAVFDMVLEDKPNPIVSYLFAQRPWPWQRKRKQSAAVLPDPPAIPHQPNKSPKPTGKRRTRR